MDRFFGFDLGDAESAISRLDKEGQTIPEVLSIRDSKSFITAYARLRNHDLLIGENACYNPNAVERKIRFKSKFLTDKESSKDVKSFAAGVLGELYLNGDLIKNEDCCFYIGCPAGWDKTAREEYRQIFEQVGYPPVRIISESRAALVSACQSKHLQVGYDILSKPVLVVDIGSSTTDFAYIKHGKEVSLQTAGEVFLGGGIMDEILLEEAVSHSSHAKRIREVFAASDPWRSYCEFAARRLKEKYFSDEDYWEQNTCSETVVINYRIPMRLTMTMNREIADKLLTKGVERLGGKSFQTVFMESLRDVRDHIEGDSPELLFLTGGVSRLPAIRAWCQEVFPDSVVIAGSEPEFSVSRGLAWSGRIDEELRQFNRELQELTESSLVEDVVHHHINDLYRAAVDALVEPILEHAALPCFDRWRSGEIRRLTDIDKEMEKEISRYLHSDEARELLIKPISTWLKPVASEIERYTVPICVRHNIPYTALSLTSFFNTSDVDIKLDAKSVFAVEEITWMINSIIAIIVGLLCGGSGIALMAEGLPGMIAGAVLSLLVLLIGKESIQGAVLKADIPESIRKMVPKGYFRSRLKKVSSEVKSSFYETLETEQNEAIIEQMVSDISVQIEQCLHKMAEVVEIPLG